jgi:hypothetical protein
VTRLPDPAGGRLPDRRGGVPWAWVAVGAVGGLVVMLLIQTVLAIVFGLVRWAVIGVVAAAIGWLVIVGPPDRKRRQ